MGFFLGTLDTQKYAKTGKNILRRCEARNAPPPHTLNRWSLSYKTLDDNEPQHELICLSVTIIFAYL